MQVPLPSPRQPAGPRDPSASHRPVQTAAPVAGAAPARGMSPVQQPGDPLGPLQGVPPLPRYLLFALTLLVTTRRFAGAGG